MHEAGRSLKPEPASTEHLCHGAPGALQLLQEEGRLSHRNAGCYVLIIVPACCYAPRALEGNKGETSLEGTQIQI